MAETVWQSVPTEELHRLADEMEALAKITEPVLSWSLQRKLETQVTMLRHHAAMAPTYNEAAANQVKRERNLASLARDFR